MKKGKNTLLAALGFLIILCSCENRKTEFTNLSNAPAIKFVSLYPSKIDASGNLTDSIKVSLKNGQAYYSFNFSYSDQDNNLSRVVPNVIFGNGLFNVGGFFTQSNVVYPVNSTTGTLEIQYKGAALGENNLTFTAIDALNKQTVINAKIIAFDNIAPVARPFVVSENKIEDPLQYNLDASSSVDFDARFGGGIKRYIWVVNGFTIYSDTAITPIIFDAAGNYSISLTVIDNDGTSSNTITLPFSF